MTQTAEELRTEAAKCDADAEESFQRCDTDGFLSQWASGKTAQLKRRQAEIIENGGKSNFACLIDAEGNIAAAREIKTRYGYCWALFANMEDANAKYGGDIIAWLGSKKKIKAAGLTKWKCERDAKAIMDGEGTGLSGTCWVATIADDGMKVNADAKLCETVTTYSGQTSKVQTLAEALASIQ